MNKHNLTVFAGLSISREAASRLVRADVMPPIKRGDLDRLRTGSVAIIDGEIADTAITMDEIRRALRRGIRISGASSVGALCAHEAREDGMTGVGWVYDAYSSGRIAGTDEIAVLYDPGSYRVLTMPLVNVRFCLEELSGQSMISAAEAASAMTSLKELELVERYRRTIGLRLASVLGIGRALEVLRRLTLSAADVKRRDAYELLLPLAAPHSDVSCQPYSRTHTRGSDCGSLLSDHA